MSLLTVLHQSETLSRAFCAHCVHHFPFFSSPLSPRPAETETMGHWQPLSPLSFLQQAQLSQEPGADPSLFPPRSPDSSPRAERRCKNKQDVWISAHKRLTTHAPRVALFCLYLGIFPPSTVSCHLERASDGISAIGRHMMGRQVDNRHVKRLTTNRRLCTHPCH